MTHEEAITYFTKCNENIISVAKDENIYDYEQQDIIRWLELPEFYEESICESCVHNYKDKISSNGICLKCDNESEYKEKSNE